MQPRLQVVLALVPLLLIGCSRDLVTPTPPPVATSHAGLIEITITGIGTPQQQASARAVGVVGPSRALGAATARGPWNAPNGTLDTRLTTLSGDGTIELVGVSTASFTWGTRLGGGYRYVSATFKVRNASATDSVAYGSPRTNLTLMAVNETGKSLSGTAISVLRKFDNTAITGSLETQILPTGWADLTGSATISTRAPDVLQVYTEAEVGATTPPIDVISIQPYGFVVRNPNNSASRTLPASPAADQFDGLLTVAYKVPLQSSAVDDPFTITGVFLAVDDGEAWVTQSFEDTDATSVSALAARATALTARVRGVVRQSVGALPAQLECTVRSGGTAGTPTQFMAESIGLSSRSPSPFLGAASHISATTALSAAFAEKVKGATSATFVVNSFQGGRAFLGGTYPLSGDSLTLSTPTPGFWPGDQVEVGLTTGLTASASGVRVCPPVVYRYRVASAAATAAFVDDTGRFGVGSQPRPIAPGDFNGDGKLDLAVGNYNNGGAGSVTLLLGDGAGGFTVASGGPFSVGNGPRGMVAADFNGDGKLDLATSNFDANTVSVLLGDGAGGFVTSQTFSVDSGQAIAAGDVNGDGILDLVIATNVSTAGKVSVLLGDGTGRFTQAAGSPYDAGKGTYGVALGDVNGDGKLDIVTGNQVSDDATVLLGDGTGQFTEASGSPVATGSGPSAVALADVDEDGRLDLIVPNSNDNNVTVLLGDGTGAFTTAATGSPFDVGGLLVIRTPWAIAIGDVNGDGHLDIVTANRDANTLTVLLNDGSGSFTAATGSPFSVGTGPRGVALAALKGDGKLAVIIANFDDNQVGVKLNP